jgi:hypothetical protein
MGHWGGYKHSLSPPTPYLKLKKMLTMDALIAEVADLRLQLQQLQSQTGKKSPCQGVTGKGTPCRNGALPGTSHCRMHSREPRPPKVSRVKRDVKPKKIQPEHSHPIDTFDPHCSLCNSHGDVIDPSLPSHTFEGPCDIVDRLREILSEDIV